MVQEREQIVDQQKVQLRRKEESLLQQRKDLEQELQHGKLDNNVVSNADSGIREEYESAMVCLFTCGSFTQLIIVSATAQVFDMQAAFPRYHNNQVPPQ